MPGGLCVALARVVCVHLVVFPLFPCLSLTASTACPVSLLPPSCSPRPPWECCVPPCCAAELVLCCPPALCILAVRARACSVLPRCVFLPPLPSSPSQVCACWPLCALSVASCPPPCPPAVIFPVPSCRPAVSSRFPQCVLVSPHACAPARPLLAAPPRSLPPLASCESAALACAPTWSPASIWLCRICVVRGGGHSHRRPPGSRRQLRPLVSAAVRHPCQRILRPLGRHATLRHTWTYF